MIAWDAGIIGSNIVLPQNVLVNSMQFDFLFVVESNCYPSKNLSHIFSLQCHVVVFFLCCLLIHRPKQLWNFAEIVWVKTIMIGDLAIEEIFLFASVRRVHRIRKVSVYLVEEVGGLMYFFKLIFLFPNQIVKNPGEKLPKWLSLRRLYFKLARKIKGL